MQDFGARFALIINKDHQPNTNIGQSKHANVECCALGMISTENHKQHSNMKKHLELFVEKDKRILGMSVCLCVEGETFVDRKCHWERHDLLRYESGCFCATNQKLAPFDTACDAICWDVVVC